MSHATADVDAGDAMPPKGKKKTIIILLIALVLVLAGGGAAAYVFKQRAAAAAALAGDMEDDDPYAEDAAAADALRKERQKNPPTFLPLDPFVVNLADRESDRFAQIGVTLEVTNAKAAEELRTYMPAIRNGILMVLSQKTSEQLLQREGKLALAREIMRESVLPLGIRVDVAAAAPARAGYDDRDPDARRRKSPVAEHSPVTAVHFSNFIVQ